MGAGDGKGVNYLSSTDYWKFDHAPMRIWATQIEIGVLVGGGVAQEWEGRLGRSGSQMCLGYIGWSSQITNKNIMMEKRVKSVC